MGEVLLPRDTGHICTALGIVALTWARPQSVNRSGGKKLAINQAAAKRLKGTTCSRPVDTGLERSARPPVPRLARLPGAGPVEADLDVRGVGETTCQTHEKGLRCGPTGDRPAHALPCRVSTGPRRAFIRLRSPCRGSPGGCGARIGRFSGRDQRQRITLTFWVHAW